MFLKVRKMLKPTLRDKRRYVIIKYLCERDEKLDIEDLISTLWKKSYEYGGYSFIANSNLNILKDLYFKDKNIFVVNVKPEYVEDLRFILMNITSIRDKRVLMYVIGVSGTIKSARRKYIEGSED